MPPNLTTCNNNEQTDTVITHPDVVFYDFYAAYTDPIASDAAAYLSKPGKESTALKIVANCSD